MTVLSILSLGPAWPKGLQIRYGDAFSAPRVSALTPQHPHRGPRPAQVIIDRDVNGDLLVGRSFMPRDLRTRIHRSDLALFDALLTGLRLFRHRDNETAIRALLRLPPGVQPRIERTTDMNGIAIPPYRAALDLLRSYAIDGLYASAELVSQFSRSGAAPSGRGDRAEQPESTMA